MTAFFRKFGLTAHITFSVGWLGAVAGFLALAIAGLTSQNPQLVLSSYISMELISWFVIIPACIGTLLTGLIQSIGTMGSLQVLLDSCEIAIVYCSNDRFVAAYAAN